MTQMCSPRNKDEDLNKKMNEKSLSKVYIAYIAADIAHELCYLIQLRAFIIVDIIMKGNARNVIAEHRTD
jgi:hypothetical protein